MSSANDHKVDEDTQVLHSMGYAQELNRRMGAFQNFAISFAIICILAGGLTAFQTAFSAGGGLSVGIGWPIGCGFALLVAAAMGQIASSYPTAGGLYHWGSILGGRGWGWATAWYNLLGLVFVVASVDVGVYDLFMGLLGPELGIDTASLGLGSKVFWVAVILVSQAALNHVGIKATTVLTDLSGYLILVTSVVLIGALLAYAPSLDFGRMFTFTNNTGDAGGGVWPATDVAFYAFLLGFLHVCYTVTGYDASAHTSEETRNAAREVPKGMMRAVFWSFLFGWALVIAILLAMPDTTEGAKQGGNVFFWTMAESKMPEALKVVLYASIVFCNYVCALAGLTSFSRMMYAFSRDGGLPASDWVKKVSPKYRTPANAIWVSAVLAFVATLYAPALTVLAAGCAVFLYLSYGMPILTGLFAEGRTWTHKGPFDLGAWSKPIGGLAVIGCLILAFVGTREPNEKVLYVVVGLAVVLVAVWYGGLRKTFQGPPTGDTIARRQKEIEAEERALGLRA